jgi:16S rRNA (cytosine1402-N4)-methyltransferase
MTSDVQYTYHIPVLLKEATSYLITNHEGVYIDGTVGGGGHAEHILTKYKKLKRYVAIDQDQQSISYAAKRLHSFRQVSFHCANFSQIDRVLAELKLESVDGILLDLGVAGYQVDTPQRGFSYMQSCLLDMRMNREQMITAAEIVNNWPEQDLAKIFYEYGEEKKSRPIARQIMRQRMDEQIMDSTQLKKIIDRVIGRAYAIKSYARIFQALRIAVNHELEHLKLFLDTAPHLLNSGGRLVIISYHSLEDRIVKNFLKAQTHPCLCPPEFPECICGKKPTFKIITKKPVRAGQDEIAANPRARSALMRSGEKL